jgi:hypothetical protein
MDFVDIPHHALLAHIQPGLIVELLGAEVAHQEQNLEPQQIEAEQIIAEIHIMKAEAMHKADHVQFLKRGGHASSTHLLNQHVTEKTHMLETIQDIDQQVI